MTRLPSRIKSYVSRIDRVLEESQRIRDQARILNVRAQLWELHVALRHREAEDAMLRNFSDRRRGRRDATAADRTGA